MTSLPPCNPPDALVKLLNDTIERLHGDVATQKARCMNCEADLERVRVERDSLRTELEWLRAGKEKQ